MRISTVFTAAAVTMVLVAAPRVVDAQIRVALLEIEGPRDERIQESLAQLVRDVGHKLINAKVYQKAAQRLRKAKLNADNVAEVCGFIDVDAVLFGSLVANGSGYTLQLRIREGKTGRLVRTLKIPAKEHALSADMKKQLRSKLIEIFDEVEPISLRGKETRKKLETMPEDRDGGEASAGGKTFSKGENRVGKNKDDPKASAKGKPDSKTAKGNERKLAKADSKIGNDKESKLAKTESKAGQGKESNGKPAKNGKSGKLAKKEGNKAKGQRGSRSSKSRAPEPDAFIDDQGSGEVAVSEDLVRDNQERAVPVRIAAGMSVQMRSLSFNFDPNLADEQRPQEYDGAPVPGVYVAGEIYPLAFNRKSSSFLRNLGIGFVVDRVLKVNVTVQDQGQDVDLAAQQMRWGVDLRYRWNIGSQPSKPTVTFSTGVGQTFFVVDEGNVAAQYLDLPDTNIFYVDPRVGLRWPFGKKISATGTASVPLVLATGEIGDDNQYGQARVLGFDGDAGLEYRANRNWLVMGGVHIAAHGFAFNGDGTATERDGNAATENDVAGALDFNVSTYLAAGYVY